MLLPTPTVARRAVSCHRGRRRRARPLRWQGWLGGRRPVDGCQLAVRRQLAAHQRRPRQNIPATLSADSRIGSHWLWLRWHTCRESAGRAHACSMLILKGDVLPAELRRLGVRLRLESVSASRFRLVGGCVTIIFEGRHAIAQRVFRNAYVAANFRAAHQSMRAVVALPMSALPPTGRERALDDRRPTRMTPTRNWSGGCRRATRRRSTCWC